MTIQTHSNNSYVFEKSRNFSKEERDVIYLKLPKNVIQKLIILLSIALKNKINQVISGMHSSVKGVFQKLTWMDDKW